MVDRTLPKWSAGRAVRHWLRDGGIKTLCDYAIVAAACLVLCSFGVVSLGAVYLSTPAPVTHQPHVLDGKRGQHVAIP